MSDNNRMCFALDLIDDPASIKQYEEYHKPQNIWPEITQSILDAGITDMEIYNVGNRLFMIMTVSDAFDENNKAELDAHNPIVIKWETLMSEFQQKIPGCNENTKWVKMKRIFKLNE